MRTATTRKEMTTEEIFTTVSQVAKCHIRNNENYSVTVLDDDTNGNSLSDMEITVRYGWGTGSDRQKYNIHDFTNYKLDYNTIGGLLRDLPEPQKIGVMTAKKLQDWIDWYKERRRRILEKENNAANTTAIFKEKIKQYNPHYNKEGNRGWIERGGLEYTFEITESGYISERIEVRTNSHNFETFVKLTDNKYKG